MNRRNWIDLIVICVMEEPANEDMTQDYACAATYYTEMGMDGFIANKQLRSIHTLRRLLPASWISLVLMRHYLKIKQKLPKISFKVKSGEWLLVEDVTFVNLSLSELSGISPSCFLKKKSTVHKHSATWKSIIVSIISKLRHCGNHVVLA